MANNRARRTSNLWTHSLKTFTLIAWLSVWTRQTAAQGPEVVTAAVRGTATLTAPSVTGPILLFTWYRGRSTDPGQQLIVYVVSSSSQTPGPQSTGRESVSPDGALSIRDLRTNDTGSYTVTVTPNTGIATAPVYRQLTVYEPVTKPTVTYVPSQLVENRGPAEITCSASKAATTILWSYNRNPALPANINQSPDNRTLTISNVSRGDSGTYQCVAANPVSSSTSDPQTLTVAYGPEGVKTDPSGSHSVQLGTKLSLSCSAGSVPVPGYQWVLNGTDQKGSGSTYTVEEVSWGDNGNYTCVARNTNTSLTANASVSIVVTESVPGLSGGAIAGIVIAVVVVLAGVGVLVYIFVFKKPASGAPDARDSTEMAPKSKEASASPKANGATPEIQYSSVNFVPKRATPAKPIAPENTVYSEVRR